jgi:hypothetical protein
MTLTLEFWATTFDFAGKFLLATLVLIVHGKIRKEGKIDAIVLKDMRIEQVLGIVALILIILGYILKLYTF